MMLSKSQVFCTDLSGESQSPISSWQLSADKEDFYLSKYRSLPYIHSFNKDRNAKAALEGSHYDKAQKTL
jgi:hypothetical protein